LAELKRIALAFDNAVLDVVMHGPSSAALVAGAAVDDPPDAGGLRRGSRQRGAASLYRHFCGIALGELANRPPVRRGRYFVRIDKSGCG
jgi:hypothetical protein